MKSRIIWLDNLKAIGIFFVLIVHTGRFNTSLNPLILSFFMPLFFFISGLFVKDKLREQSLISFIKKKAINRLIPYLVFNIISYIFWFYLLRQFKNPSFATLSPLQPFLGIFYGVGGYGWLQHNISLWFLTCLFSTEILFFILIKIKSKKVLIFNLLICSTIGYFFFWLTSHYSYQIPLNPDPIQYRLPWGFDLAFTAVVFYGIGYLSQNYILTDNLIKCYRWPIISISLFCYLVFTYLNNNKVNFIIGKYGNYFYFYLAALGGILFWVHIARIIPPNFIFRAVGKHTLVIFSLHLLVFPLITGFIVYALKIPKSALEDSFLVAIIYTVIAITLLIRVSIAMEKHTPLLLGKLSAKKFN